MAKITDKTSMKALATIAILMGRRETWSLITYGDLAERLDHPPYALNDILDAVGAWCRSLDKLSLVLTVVGENGEPAAEGLYKFGTTPGNYLARRIQLYRDSAWKSVALPTLEQIAEAYKKSYNHEQN
jgi:hypothetical protein